MGPLTFDARLYLVAPAQLQAGALRDLVPELAAAGVGAIQLREKEMEAGDLMRAAAPVLDRCRDASVPFILNDRPDVALALGADGVHVGQNDLPVPDVRRILPGATVGWSTHARSEVDAAADQAIDYFAVGPVYETPTKLGREAVGLDLVRYAADRATHPWFAIGGIDRITLEEVRAAGAERIVVVRAITEAVDPPSAAAELIRLLGAPV